MLTNTFSLLSSAGTADFFTYTLPYTIQSKYQNTKSGSMTPNGIFITVTALVPPNAQMCFLVIQHVTHNQLSPRSVDTDSHCHRRHHLLTFRLQQTGHYS